jgi:hypothetical protein
LSPPVSRGASFFRYGIASRPWRRSAPVPIPSPSRPVEVGRSSHRAESQPANTLKTLLLRLWLHPRRECPRGFPSSASPWG